MNVKNLLLLENARYAVQSTLNPSLLNDSLLSEWRKAYVLCRLIGML